MPYQIAVFLAALLSGLLFGFVHGEPHTFPILAFLGIALAYAFQLARSMYSSMVIHGLVNALAVIALLAGG
jgi:membrane protease YdiL (CAAX protease family)